MRIATWNVEWAKPGTDRGHIISDVLEELAADVIVLTEGSAGLLSREGHIVDAGDDWGYTTIHPDRRKILMWSRNPWSDIHVADPDRMPTGRYVGATTPTPQGEVRVVGVCIPWSAAHVSTGRKDQKRWAEHEAHLRGLQEIIQPVGSQTVVTGDFNQKIPRDRQPLSDRIALADHL